MSRNVLLVTHSGRQEAITALRSTIPSLRDLGFIVYAADLPSHLVQDLGVEVFSSAGHTGGIRIEDFEIVIVLGGDGTILRAAELVFGSDVPLVGINLGHVGFLAESERDDLAAAVRRIAGRDYEVEERRILQVTVFRPGFAEPVRDWALNEAAVEKSEPAKMIEVSLAVDGRPVSSFGCDAVITATATGSTAHAFSAGGPVVWPDVAAKVVVPVAAHALFARPLVVGPGSDIHVDILAESSVPGVLITDGRRQTALPPGSRVELKTSPNPIVFARLNTSTFTDRLVSKFKLPVVGWRDANHRDPMSSADLHGGIVGSSANPDANPDANTKELPGA
ncbi:NAD kinase [Timonella senegalensis]|uniref:NAD kinase n=1 Tax=Timonella senegalensis TaxID=1465825 RepID=UPI0028A61F8A|nr:NAD kinase [Timonella senegalensis]